MQEAANATLNDRIDQHASYREGFRAVTGTTNDPTEFISVVNGPLHYECNHNQQDQQFCRIRLTTDTADLKIFSNFKKYFYFYFFIIYIIRSCVYKWCVCQCGVS